MAVRTISTKLTLDGEKQFKSELADINSNLKTLKSEMQLATEEFTGQANSMEALERKGKILRDEYDQQEEKVRALEQAVKDAAEAFGDSDKKTDGYRQSLNRAKTDLMKLNREIEDNDRYLDEARSSADHCASSIDRFGREAKDAGDEMGSGFADLKDLVTGLEDMKKALTGGVVTGAVIGGFTKLKDGIIEVVDGSKEFRQIMGTLETSAQAAGYSTEETYASFERLYGVLGDAQQAATTVANLQAIGLSQEDLMRVTDMSIGAWARYGDSIPIDGLAESINETIQAGKVTGVFADVLNWAGESEDGFNEKLAAATTSAERADIVLQMMAQQGLADSADAWYTLNGDISAANESQLRYEEAQAKLGEALSPMRDWLRDLGTHGFEFLADKVTDVIGIIDDVKDAFNELRSMSFSDLWDRLTNQTISGDPVPTGRLDGSHAAGLARVPYDGYTAELHRDEAVLTANEAAVWRSLQLSGATDQQGNQMAAVGNMMAQAVNAMGTMVLETGRQPIEVNVKINGKTLYRETIDDFRTVNRERPEVLDDE